MISDKIRKLANEVAGKKFKCIQEGRIEIIKGDPRSAEVKEGDIFIATKKHNLGYEGGLEIQSGYGWSHQPGFSGIRNLDTTPRDYEFICLLRDDNINGTGTFFAQFEEIKNASMVNLQFSPTGDYEFTRRDQDMIRGILEAYGEGNFQSLFDVEFAGPSSLYEKGKEYVPESKWPKFKKEIEDEWKIKL